MPALKYFTQSSILRQIGHRRLAILLGPFRDELILRNLTLPVPDPKSDDYFADLANALSATESLPHSLRKALFTIEAAASPENNARLWAAIKRRIPCVSVSTDCPLDRALELWFAAPDELSKFLPEVEPRIHTHEHGLLKQVDAVISPNSEPPISNGISVNPCPSVVTAPTSTPQPFNASTT